jgi:5-methylcytosine-specific restriction endonuclease McrA
MNEKEKTRKEKGADSLIGWSGGDEEVRIEALQRVREAEWVGEKERAKINSYIRQLRLKRANRLGKHTQVQWKKLVQLVGGICVRCSEASEKLEKDHIIPIYQGGSNSIRNIQPLCGRCNRQKGPERINWVRKWRQAQKVKPTSTFTT